MAYGALRRRDGRDAAGRAVDVRRAPAATCCRCCISRVFGSVFAFGAYLTLLKRVGAGPSAFVTTCRRRSSRMALSTLFEGYRWTRVVGAGRRRSPRSATGSRCGRLRRRAARSTLLQRDLRLDDQLLPVREIASRSALPSRSGGPRMISAPSRSRRSRTSGCASTFCVFGIEPARRSRGGVPAGATMPQ